MKFLLPILLLSTFLPSSPLLKNEGREQQVDTTKARIKQITEYEYRAVLRSGKIVKTDLFQKTLEYYDTLGYDVYARIYNPEGILFCTRTFTLDERGNLTEMLSVYASDSSIHKISNRYDEQNNCIESEYRYDKSREFTRYRYTFDEKGRIAKAQSYDEHNRLKGWSEYDYTHDTLVSALICYDENGKLQNVNRYKFNKDLYRTEWVQYDKDLKTILHKFTWSYDSQNNLIEYSEYRYNGHYARTSKERYEGYDEHGNYTRKITFDNDGDPDEILERVIVYR